MTHTYYPISTLTRDNFPVFFPIAGLRLHGGELLEGQEVVGMLKTYRKGRPTEAKVYRVRRADTSYEDLPRHLTPTLWRPINVAKFPDPLPKEAATLTAPEIPWGSAHPEPTEADEPSPLDWIGPYNLPGSISREEAEIRVLRGLKTELARGVDEGSLGPKAYGSTLDGMIPRTLAATGWAADKRDVGDWLTATQWLRHIDRINASIIRFKAQDYSFRQISVRFIKHLQRERVREKYHEGMEQVVKVANQGARR